MTPDISKRQRALREMPRVPTPDWHEPSTKREPDRGRRAQSRPAPGLEQYLRPPLQAQPQSIEAEAAVLGSLILAPEDCWHEVAGSLTVEDFYKEAHRVIFGTMLHMVEVAGDAAAIDVSTLAIALRGQAHGERATKLDAVGGVAALAELFNAVGTAASIGHYVKVVRQKAMQRKVLALTNDLDARLHGPVDDLPAALMDHAGAVLELAHGGVGDGVSAREAGKLVYAAISAQIEGERKHCLSLGLPSVDEMLGGGIKPGKYVLAQALTNHGKSVFANHIIERSQDPIYHVPSVDAKGHERTLPGWWVLYFSTEIPAAEACQNLLGYMGGYWPKHLEDDIATLGGDALEQSRAWTGFLSAYKRLRGFDVTFYDQTKGLTSEIVSGLALRRLQIERRQADREGRPVRPGLVIVDYLQELRDAPRHGQSDYHRLMDASRKMRDLAKRNEGLSVFVTAQTHNRAKGARQPPQPEDVRDMPGCNADLDAMLGICRPSRYDKKQDPQQYHVGALKGRSADVSEVVLRFRTDRGGRLEEDGEWVPQGGFVDFDALTQRGKKK